MSAGELDFLRKKLQAALNENTLLRQVIANAYSALSPVVRVNAPTAPPAPPEAPVVAPKAVSEPDMGFHALKESPENLDGGAP